MAKQPTLKAEIREITGKKVKRLRQEDLLPANIFGAAAGSQAITLDRLDFEKLYAAAGETTLINLNVEGEKKPRPVLVSEVQFDPVTDLPLHVDLHQVDLTQTVTATVPVEAIGESPAVKEEGGVLFIISNEVEVEALPTDIPDKIEIDISRLETIGDSLLLKDLEYDREKVDILLDEDATIVTVQERKEEEVEEEAVPAEVDLLAEDGELPEGVEPEDVEAAAETKEGEEEEGQE